MFPVSPDEVTEKAELFAVVCANYVSQITSPKGFRKEKFGTEELGEAFKGSDVEQGLLKGPGTGREAGGKQK